MKKLCRILLAALVVSLFFVVSAFAAPGENGKSFDVNIVVNGDDYAATEIGASAEGNVYTFELAGLLDAFGFELNYDEECDIAVLSAKPNTLAAALFSQMNAVQPASGEPNGMPSEEPSAEPSAEPFAEPSAEPAGDTAKADRTELIRRALEDLHGVFYEETDEEPSAEPSGEPSEEPAEGPGAEPAAEPVPGAEPAALSADIAPADAAEPESAPAVRRRPPIRVTIL